MYVVLRLVSLLYSTASLLNRNLIVPMLGRLQQLPMYVLHHRGVLTAVNAIMCCVYAEDFG